MGQYRKKICPVCGTEHRNRRQYCSPACGRGEQAKKISNWMRTSDQGAEIIASNLRHATPIVELPAFANILQQKPHGSRCSAGDFWMAADSTDW